MVRLTRIYTRGGDTGKPSARDQSSLLEALAQLRLRLLDLTGRNRLLNFRHTAGRSLQFVEGKTAAIYQKLVESLSKSSITILGLPEPKRKDWVERNGRLARPDPRDWARQQEISTSYDLQEPDGVTEESNVRALLYPDDLAKHCRKIEREANLAIEETGANMLFLVLGFLEFPDQRDSDRTFTAPLISIPVSMSKRDIGGNQVFSLQYTGDDIAENLSLREKLKADHSLILPELDEDQFDVEDYFALIQKIIKSHPGFAFRHRISLTLVSFTNMLLVRDLDPTKWPQVGDQHSLLDHPIVRKVFEGSAEEAESGLGIAGEHPVEEGPGAKIPLVYDADSSQHSALVDVLSERRNLVIEGPPGTGKSQTITNLVAAYLAEGKKVLFVAEKLAALEVVKNRLSQVGLDPFVLELHSNKTNKKRVLEEIGRRVSYRPNPPAGLPRKLQELEAHRNDLKAYADLINSVAHNRFGLTLHQVMWRTEKHRRALSIEEAPLTQISISDAAELSEFELSRRMDCLGHLGAQHQLIGGFDADSTFWGFFPDRIVPGDEIRLERLFSSSNDWAQAFIENTSAYGVLLGGTVVGLTADFARTQLDVLRELLASVDERVPLHLLPGFFEGDNTGVRVKRQLETFAAQLERYHRAAPIARKGLRKEQGTTQDRLESLRQLDRAAASLGAKLGTPSEIGDLSNALRTELGRLGSAVSAIRAFCEERRIPFDGSRDQLAKLVELARLVAEVPEEQLHLQYAGLTRDGCVQALESLSSLQQQWTALTKDLDGILYMDALPAEGVLKQAILTFREGDAWYRIFQSRWRVAVAFHKRLQRTKQRVPTKQRLEQLEQVVGLLQLKDRWKSDPSWDQFLGFMAPADALPLDGHLALAKWNRAAKILLEDLQIQPFAPSDLTPEKARSLRREFSSLNFNLSTAIGALHAIDGILPKLAEVRGGRNLHNVQELATLLAAGIGSQMPWLEEEVHSQVVFVDCLAACEAAIERQRIAAEVDTNAAVRGLLGEHFASVDTDVDAAIAILTFGQSIDDLNLAVPIKAKLRSGHFIEVSKALIASLNKVLDGLERVRDLAEQLSAFGKFDLASWVGFSAHDNLQKFAEGLKVKIDTAVDDTDLIIPWSLYVARRKEAQELGLGDFVGLVEGKRVPPAELANAYAYCTYATIVRGSFRKIPQLGRFSGLKHNQIRNDFRRLDREIIELRGKAVAAQCHAAAITPFGLNGPRVNDKTEMVLLNYLLPQQRPRMLVRKMLTKAGAAIQALKPCFMMGPQAVAQYLTPGHVTFDLVIMDEASQLKPEEAIGAIARGSQLVVVGDPKQLPPTSFFSRMSQTSDDDEQYITTDAESILDVCSAHFRPPRALRWHYRSQHHSLIAFSNHYFYRRNPLIIFPSPYGQSSRLGVRATYLADAVYDNQTNLKEAKRVVDAVVEHINDRPNESLGVVTLNIKQRDLIAELLDERLRISRAADAYREHWANEGRPLFAKNLENVQGDERDAIIISTTFGKPPGANSVRQNFGPISRQGGWRRLNVLFTRARRSVAIYTSLRPEDIIIDGATPEGTKALRNYLEYARTRLLTGAEETGQEPDSDFEIAVIDVLRGRGYEVTPQLGVAGYRIDIAVKHPDALGSYLAAIECDGASYHSARSVRDRDRIRQDILESLGWRGRIWRIWSTDWFRTPRQETEKLIGFLEDLRNTWKPEHPAGEAWVEEGVPTVLRSTAQTVQTEERRAVSEVLLQTEEEPEVEAGDLVRYADITKPEDVLTVRITHKSTDLANGLISEATPLAQTLLGSVVGDEVSLHVPGSSPRVFRILEIKRGM